MFTVKVLRWIWLFLCFYVIFSNFSYNDSTLYSNQGYKKQIRGSVPRKKGDSKKTIELIFWIFLYPFFLYLYFWHYMFHWCPWSSLGLEFFLLIFFRSRYRVLDPVFGRKQDPKPWFIENVFKKAFFAERKKSAKKGQTVQKTATGKQTDIEEKIHRHK